MEEQVKSVHLMLQRNLSVDVDLEVHVLTINQSIYRIDI